MGRNSSIDLKNVTLHEAESKTYLFLKRAIFELEIKTTLATTHVDHSCITIHDSAPCPESFHAHGIVSASPGRSWMIFYESWMVMQGIPWNRRNLDFSGKSAPTFCHIVKCTTTTMVKKAKQVTTCFVLR